MLVLSRNQAESLMIGGVKVTVLGIRGDKVRIGIEAPAHVSVDRQEVFDAKLKEGLKRRLTKDGESQ